MKIASPRADRLRQMREEHFASLERQAKEEKPKSPTNRKMKPKRKSAKV